MIKQVNQLIILNEARDKILSRSAIRFHDVEEVLKNTTKAWHLRDFLYDNKEDCNKIISWIEHYSKDKSINFNRIKHCKAMLKEGFIIKKATIVFNLDI